MTPEDIIAARQWIANTRSLGVVDYLSFVAKGIDGHEARPLADYLGLSEKHQREHNAMMIDSALNFIAIACFLYPAAIDEIERLQEKTDGRRADS
jgi:hypothetical protein